MSKHPPARHAEKKRLSRERAWRRVAQAKRRGVDGKLLLEIDAALKVFWDTFKVDFGEPLYFAGCDDPPPRVVRFPDIPGVVIVRPR
jgi:hypothetical protein